MEVKNEAADIILRVDIRDNTRDFWLSGIE